MRLSCFLELVPFLRASDNPIAIACLRLFIVPPLPPRKTCVFNIDSLLCGRLGVEICPSEVAAAISAAFDESVSSCNLQLCQQWDPAWGEAGPYLRLRSVYSVVSFLEGCGHATFDSA